MTGNNLIRRALRRVLPAAAVKPTLPELAMRQPRPLINRDKGLILVFSPKSACSSAIIWFFRTLGIDDAAMAYSPWPHRYRKDVYYRSPAWHGAWSGDLSGFHVVRVIRDPYSRATSSFRHAVTTGYADETIRNAIGRDPASDGISFSDFLDFLEAIDLTASNPHHRVQFHPIEDRLPPADVINVSRRDLFAELNRVERERRLPVTDFTTFDWINRTDDRRQVRKQDLGDAYDLRLRRRGARGRPWPTEASLLTRTARQRIAGLYRIDLERYADWL